MFESANPVPFHLYIEGADRNLSVLSFSGTEAINAPFSFRLIVSCKSGTLDLAALLHQPAYLAFAGSGHGIHGFIAQVGQTSVAGDAGHYQITLRPQLATLAHRRHKRIFEQLSVPQVLARVLHEHGLKQSAYAFHLSADYPEREHCVQYNENNLQFIQRLCEEEGLRYHFQHSRQGHQVVFSDGDFFRRIAPQRFDASANHSSRQGIKHFGVTTVPHALQRSICAFGESDQPQLTSGYFLPLSGHLRAEWNSLWLLTEIHHHYQQETRSSLPVYSNRFRAQPWDEQFEASTQYSKPDVQGCQTGRVVAHDPASPHRVKVQFNWGRQAPQTQINSYWASVKHGLGHTCAALSRRLPPLESEVEIGFINGDPDKPLVLYWQNDA